MHIHSENSFALYKVGVHGGQGCAIGSGCGPGQGGSCGIGLGYGASMGKGIGGGGHFCGGDDACKPKEQEAAKSESYYMPTHEELSRGLSDMYKGRSYIPTQDQLSRGLLDIWKGSPLSQPKKEAKSEPVHVADARSCFEIAAKNIVLQGGASTLAGAGAGKYFCPFTGPAAAHCQTAFVAGGITYGAVKGFKEALESPDCETAKKDGNDGPSEAKETSQKEHISDAFAEVVEV